MPAAGRSQLAAMGRNRPKAAGAVGPLAALNGHSMCLQK